MEERTGTLGLGYMTGEKRQMLTKMAQRNRSRAKPSGSRPWASGKLNGNAACGGSWKSISGKRGARHHRSGEVEKLVRRNKRHGDELEIRANKTAS